MSPSVRTHWLPAGRQAAWAERLRTQADLRAGHPAIGLDSDLARSLSDWNERLGARPKAASLLRDLPGSNALTIVTGQQPAVLGGPLYTLYKLLGAISVAAKLASETGRPVLPVFWIVGDDSDFGEVSSTWWFETSGKLEQWRVDTSPTRGALVGRLPVSEQEGLTKLAVERLSAEVAPRVAYAFGVARTWSEFLAALCFRLLPNDDFVLIDGASEPLLRAATEAFLRRASSLPLADLIAEGATEAQRAGYEPAFTAELGDRALFRIEGETRVSRASETRASGPELLAPNVLLRPVLQDWLLRNVATVGGPSEIQYRAQLGPIYRALSVPEPVVLPRMQGLALPRPSGAADADYFAAALDPGAFVESRLRQDAEHPAIRALEGARNRARGDEATLLSEMTALDRSLEQLVASAWPKIDYQFQRVREGAENKLRQRRLKQEPELAWWRDLAEPRGKPQERVLSMLWPATRGGAAFYEAARRAAGEQCERAWTGEAGRVLFELPAAGTEGS